MIFIVRKVVPFVLLLFFCFANSGQVLAIKNEREVIFSKLQQAFSAQLSLSEKTRTMKEINAVLQPYFTQAFISTFLNENLQMEKTGYIVYGSDAAGYYVPFFSYDKKTKVVFNEDQSEVIVYEFFRAEEESPVYAPDHYEALKLKKISQKWYIQEWIPFSNNPPSFPQASGKKSKKTVYYPASFKQAYR